MKHSILILAVLITAFSSNAATYQTILSGPVSDINIWDCACLPGASDNVIIRNDVTISSTWSVEDLQISSGSSLTTSSGNLRILGLLQIDPGATLTNNSMMTIKSDYLLNGTHAGNGTVRFSGNGSIDGTGSFTNTKGIDILSGHRFVSSTAILDFSSVTIQMKGTSKFTNNGDFTVSFMRGNGLNFIYNRTGGTLTVENEIQPGVELRFEEVDNTLIYNMIGISNQGINTPDFGFYNLELRGNSLNSKKRPFNDIVINGELTIDNCTFDVRKSGVNYDVEIQGDWNNISGRFNPRTGLVNFSGSGTIFSHNGLEGFYDVEFSGASQLLCDISVSSETFISSMIDANGFDITTEGDWICVGDYIANGGSVIFEGTATSYVSGITDFDHVNIDKSSSGEVTATGTMNIYETLWMNNGVLNTNDNVIIASNSSRTGRVGEMGSATFNGDLTVERYMLFGSNGWHLIGSSVDDMSIADWNDDFITTGFTGADWPTYGFCNITKYDETVLGEKDLGVSNVSSTAESVPNGEGRRAYIASGYNKLSVKGPALTGPFSWSVTYTDSGSPDDDGWNLISNPYPSTIDWDDTGNWTRTGVKDAIYVWVSEDEQYTSYIAGVGTNGGTRYIPSSQAFWVQTDAAGPTLSLVEAAKVDEDETFRNNENISYFKVIMSTANQRTDELAVRLDDQATYAFDGSYDAYELRSTNGNNPSVGLLTEDGKNTSIYSFPELTEETSIPMSLYVGVSGDVDFSIEGFQTFTQGQSVKIFDSMTDEYHSLRDGVSTSLTLDAGEYNGRFYLVISPRILVEDIRSNATNSEYTVWTDEANIFVKGNGSDELVDIQIVNALGQQLLSEKAVNLNTIYRTGIDAYRGLIIVDIINRNDGTRTTQRIIN